MDPLLQIEDSNVVVQPQGGNKKRGVAHTIDSWVGSMPNFPPRMATNHRADQSRNPPERVPWTVHVEVLELHEVLFSRTTSIVRNYNWG